METGLTKEMIDQLAKVRELRPNKRRNILEGIATIGANAIFINEQREKEAQRTHDLLNDIFHELIQIRKLLEWAAQNPNDTLDKWGAAVIADDMKPKKPESERTYVYADEVFSEDWTTGPEAAKMIGWKTCNVRMLKQAEISFIQAGKGRSLKVYLPDVANYIQKRHNKKSRVK